MLTNNIVNTLIENAKKFPDTIAIIDINRGLFKKSGYRKVTYAELNKDIRLAAQKLKEMGFEKGDRIIVFTPMSYELYVILLAVFYIGAVTVFIDAWADRKRLANACTVVKPKGFIGCLKAHILRLVPEIRKIPIKVLDTSVFDSSKRTVPVDIEPADIHPDDEGLITLTTGSTGLPKGAKRTHGFLYNQFLIFQKHISLPQGDVNLTALPVFVFYVLGEGVTSVLPMFNPAQPSAFNPSAIIKQVHDLNITSAFGSPVFFDKIADHMIANKQTLKIDRIITGGAPVFKSLGKKLKKALPDTSIEIAYGCTEAEPISSLTLEEMLGLDLSLGLAVGHKDPAIDIKVIRAITGPVMIKEAQTLDDYLVPNGETGEFIVSGPHVLKEYIGSPDSFKENKIVDGDKIWHRTGDAGLFDKNGLIFLHGRIKNPIHLKGGIVYALPYEQRLLEIDGIAFAAVIEFDGRIFVCIEPKEKASQNTILEKAKQELKDLGNANFMIMEKIPKDPRHNSKVDFTKMKELLEHA